MFKAVLQTDGGSRGNPGLAGLGYTLTDEQGQNISHGGWFLGEASNNVAEYSAFIWGLQNALAARVSHLLVKADSELMVKQMNGLYKVRSEDLKPLFLQAQSLLSSFEELKIEHVYRSENKEADRLANEAMDTKSPVGAFVIPWDSLSAPTSLLDVFEKLAPDNNKLSAILAELNAAVDQEDLSDVYAFTEEVEKALPPDYTEGRAMEKNTRYAGPHQLSGESYEHAGGHYEMTLRDHFDAAHTLPGYNGPCRYLHGHTWDVELTIAGEHLDELGILYDFKDLKRNLHAVLENFDHRYINDIPPFDLINPTAENLARIIFYELEKVFPTGISLQEVAVWESPVAKTVYRP